MPSLQKCVQMGAVAFGLLCATLTHAQSVNLAGILGSKALVVIDGTPPKALGAGETHMGVKVLSVSKEEAQVEVSGQARTLRLGEAPVSVKTANGGAKRKVVLSADSRGHFINTGAINDKSMRYMVDTGATTVAIGKPDADRMGLDYSGGQAVQMSTANGLTRAWRMKLDKVRIGDIEVFGVEAVVTQEAMPYVLLGNSFLAEFLMTRTSDQMVLEKRR